VRDLFESIGRERRPFLDQSGVRSTEGVEDQTPLGPAVIALDA
jgi:hypothetical protein